MKAAAPAVAERFNGFPKTALSFLEAIRKHNDREWFLPRKPAYEEQLKRPMELLVHEVSAGCQAKGFAIFPKRPSPVTRIYRDTRFFPEKGPLHHFVGGMLVGRSTVGEAYIHIAPEGCFVAAGIYMPPTPIMKAIRERIASRPQSILELARVLKSKKLELVDEWKLKRMPRGFETFAHTPAAEYLKLNCFIVRRSLEPEQIVSKALVKTLVKFTLDARPLLEWGWSFAAAAPKVHDLIL